MYKMKNVKGNLLSGVANPHENEKNENVETALLDSSVVCQQPRYGNSELKQFCIILKRTLLFSRRDWVSYVLWTVHVHRNVFQTVKQFSNISMYKRKCRRFVFVVDSYVLASVRPHLGWNIDRRIVFQHRK